MRFGMVPDDVSLASAVRRASTLSTYLYMSRCSMTACYSHFTHIVMKSANIDRVEGTHVNPNFMRSAAVGYDQEGRNQRCDTPEEIVPAHWRRIHFSGQRSVRRIFDQQTVTVNLSL